jgi:hypothetical protein
MNTLPRQNPPADPTTTLHVLLLVAASGGGASCTGTTPEEARIKAEALKKRFPKVYVGEMSYTARPSEKFPGMWDTTPTPEALASLSPEARAKYLAAE